MKMCRKGVRRVTNVRYANQLGITTKRERELQILANMANKEDKLHGMKMYVKNANDLSSEQKYKMSRVTNGAKILLAGSRTNIRIIYPRLAGIVSATPSTNIVP